MFALSFFIVALATVLLQSHVVVAPPPTSTDGAASAQVSNLVCHGQHAYRRSFMMYSMQKACAKTTYGGDVDSNAGAYGFYSQQHSAVFRERGWPVRFEPVTTYNVYSNPRQQFLCLQRCWSHVQLPDQRTPVRQNYRVLSVPLRQTWLIRAEQSHLDWKTEIPTPPGKGSTMAQAIEIVQVPERRSWWQHQTTQSKSVYVALHPESRITCSADIPVENFPILPAESSHRYTSIQEFCATALDGGNPDVNMGGACRARKGTNPPHVYFEPNLTPCLWSIPDGEAFGHGAIVRAAQFFCFYYCTCADTAETEASVRAGKQLVNVPWMQQSSIAPVNGGMRIVTETAGGVIDVILRPTAGGGAVAEQCADGNCRPVPKDVLEKVLQLPTEASLFEDVNPPPLDSRTGVSPVCNRKCRGAGGCTPSCPLCAAGLPRMESVRASDRGRLVVFDSSWCSPLASMGVGSLLPRDGFASCACNSTYVSSACCEAEMDGLVWEDPKMRIGELAREVTGNETAFLELSLE